MNNINLKLGSVQTPGTLSNQTKSIIDSLVCVAQENSLFIPQETYKICCHNTVIDNIYEKVHQNFPEKNSGLTTILKGEILTYLLSSRDPDPVKTNKNSIILQNFLAKLEANITKAGRLEYATQLWAYTTLIGFDSLSKLEIFWVAFSCSVSLMEQFYEKRKEPIPKQLLWRKHLNQLLYRYFNKSTITDIIMKQAFCRSEILEYLPILINLSAVPYPAQIVIIDTIMKQNLLHGYIRISSSLGSGKTTVVSVIASVVEKSTLYVCNYQETLRDVYDKISYMCPRRLGIIRGGRTDEPEKTKNIFSNYEISGVKKILLSSSEDAIRRLPTIAPQIIIVDEDIPKLDMEQLTEYAGRYNLLLIAISATGIADTRQLYIDSSPLTNPMILDITLKSADSFYTGINIIKHFTKEEIKKLPSDIGRFIPLEHMITDIKTAGKLLAPENILLHGVYRTFYDCWIDIPYVTPEKSNNEQWISCQTILSQPHNRGLLVLVAEKQLENALHRTNNSIPRVINSISYEMQYLPEPYRETYMRNILVLCNRNFRRAKKIYGHLVDDRKKFGTGIIISSFENISGVDFTCQNLYIMGDISDVPLDALIQGIGRINRNTSFTKSITGTVYFELENSHNILISKLRETCDL